MCRNCHPERIAFAGETFIQNEAEDRGDVSITARFDKHCRPATKAQPPYSTKIEKENTLMAPDLSEYFAITTNTLTGYALITAFIGCVALLIINLLPAAIRSYFELIYSGASLPRP